MYNSYMDDWGGVDVVSDTIIVNSSILTLYSVTLPHINMKNKKWNREE